MSNLRDARLIIEHLAQDSELWSPTVRTDLRETLEAAEWSGAPLGRLSAIFFAASSIVAARIVGSPLDGKPTDWRSILDELDREVERVAARSPTGPAEANRYGGRQRVVDDLAKNPALWSEHARVTLRDVLGAAERTTGTPDIWFAASRILLVAVLEGTRGSIQETLVELDRAVAEARAIAPEA